MSHTWESHRHTQSPKEGPRVPVSHDAEAALVRAPELRGFLCSVRGLLLCFCLPPHHLNLCSIQLSLWPRMLYKLHPRIWDREVSLDEKQNTVRVPHAGSQAKVNAGSSFLRQGSVNIATWFLRPHNLSAKGLKSKMFLCLWHVITFNKIEANSLLGFWFLCYKV